MARYTFQQLRTMAVTAAGQLGSSTSRAILIADILVDTQNHGLPRSSRFRLFRSRNDRRRWEDEIAGLVVV